MDESKQPGLFIGQIFLHRAVFEQRDDALSYPAVAANVGEINVSIEMETRGKEDDSEGIIVVTVQSVETDKLYRFLVQMIGMVKQDEEHKNLGVREYLSKQGPAMMFPFVRE